MKTLFIAASAVVLSAGVSITVAQAAQLQTAAPTATDAAAPAKADTATFIKAVPSANAFEIQSSALAVKNDVAADVKEFAALMIKDHTKAGEDFKQALTGVDMTAATAQGLSADDQTKLDALAKLEGAAFQAQYILNQADAHKAAVALFSNYAQSGDDPALKEFAKKTLPTLEMHERQVKELQAAHQG